MIQHFRCAERLNHCYQLYRAAKPRNTTAVLEKRMHNYLTVLPHVQVSEPILTELSPDGEQVEAVCFLVVLESLLSNGGRGRVGHTNGGHEHDPRARTPFFLELPCVGRAD